MHIIPLCIYVCIYIYIYICVCVSYYHVGHLQPRQLRRSGDRPVLTNNDDNNSNDNTNNSNDSNDDHDDSNDKNEYVKSSPWPFPAQAT